MSAPQNLLQAAVNRLAARMGSAVADTAAGLAVLAQDAPARLQQELTLFWQEVELEALVQVQQPSLQQQLLLLVQVALQPRARPL